MGSRDLRQCAARRCNQRRRTRHSFDRWERKTLVQRRYAGQLGLVVQLDDPFIGDAAYELHRIGQAEIAKGVFGLRVLFELADNHDLDVALSADLRRRFEQVDQALHCHVGARCRDDPAGHTRHVWKWGEHLRVDADRHDVDLVHVDLMVGADVVL